MRVERKRCEAAAVVSDAIVPAIRESRPSLSGLAETAGGGTGAAAAAVVAVAPVEATGFLFGVGGNRTFHGLFEAASSAAKSLSAETGA